jgi:mRNA interferase YafQ
MRTISRSTAFKRDYKRESKGRHRSTLDAEVEAILARLLNDRALEPHQRDHELIGEWSGFRECHIKPDLLLIYRKPDDAVLELARLGSHSELFG